MTTASVGTPPAIPQATCTATGNPWEGGGGTITFNAHGTGTLSTTSATCGAAGPRSARVDSPAAWCYSDGRSGNRNCNTASYNYCSSSCRAIPAPPAASCPAGGAGLPGMLPPGLSLLANETLLNTDTGSVQSSLHGGTWAASSTTMSFTCTYFFYVRWQIRTDVVNQFNVVVSTSTRWTTPRRSSSFTDSGSCTFSRGSGSWSCSMDSMGWGA